MKTRIEKVIELCEQGYSYSEAMDIFYDYWEAKIRKIKEERKAPLLVST